MPAPSLSTTDPDSILIESQEVRQLQTTGDPLILMKLIYATHTQLFHSHFLIRVCVSISLQSLSFLFFSLSESYVTGSVYVSPSQSVSHLTVCERFVLGVAQKQVDCILLALKLRIYLSKHCFFN